VNPLAVTLIIAAIFVGGLAFASIAIGRGQYESAKFELLKKEGRFELRRYEELSLVASPMKVEGTKGRDGSFMRLFGYISGENASEAKISMTTPVFVGADGKDSNVMSFVLPESVALSGSPQPSSGNVYLTEWDEGDYAVYRFAGLPRDKREDKALQKLKEWMTAQGLEAMGDHRFAYYDPPWTPGPVRRNEVLIPVKPIN